LAEQAELARQALLSLYLQIKMWAISEVKYLVQTLGIANLMKKSGCDVKPWMLELKNPGRKKWKELEKNPLNRKTISTDIRKNTDKGFMKVIQGFSKKLRKYNEKKKTEVDPMIKDIEVNLKHSKF
jgi:hypothetical protein